MLTEAEKAAARRGTVRLYDVAGHVQWRKGDEL